MSDTEKIINALKDEYSYWQNIAYEAQKEGDEEGMTWYYGKATGIKKIYRNNQKNEGLRNHFIKGILI